VNSGRIERDAKPAGEACWGRGAGRGGGRPASRREPFCPATSSGEPAGEGHEVAQRQKTRIRFTPWPVRGPPAWCSVLVLLTPACGLRDGVAAAPATAAAGGRVLAVRGAAQVGFRFRLPRLEGRPADPGPRTASASPDTVRVRGSCGPRRHRARFRPTMDRGHRRGPVRDLNRGGAAGRGRRGDEGRGPRSPGRQAPPLERGFNGPPAHPRGSEAGEGE